MAGCLLNKEEKWAFSIQTLIYTPINPSIRKERKGKYGTISTVALQTLRLKNKGYAHGFYAAWKKLKSTTTQAAGPF